jgi:hypothetical protein
MTNKAIADSATLIEMRAIFRPRPAATRHLILEKIAHETRQPALSPMIV